jgi:hypothetical protein
MTENKKIDGSLANYLADAVGHFARLECELAYLQWLLCYRDLSGDGRMVRKHCRNLLHAIEMVDHFIHEADGDDKKVVSIEEQRKKP